MRPDWWYTMHLQKHFDKYYHAYEEVVEWHVNPAFNKWKFDLPNTKLTVVLTCDEDGNVTGERFLTRKD